MTDAGPAEPQGTDEPARPGQWAARLRGLAVDVAPLREFPDFRRLWTGQAVSLVGSQMTVVAVPVQVYAITKSSFAVGLLGLVVVVPMVAFGLFGGAVADALDRRRVLLLTSSGLALLSGLLWLQAMLDVRRVGVLYLLVGLQAALFSVDSPARQALVPRLLPPERIPAATALNQVMFTFGIVVGPLLGGAVISLAGLRWAYAVDAATFAAALLSLSRLPPVPPLTEVLAPGVRSVLEGLRYLRSRPVLLMTFAVDLDAMVFGMPRALFPAYAEKVFHGGAGAVGVLYAAPAVGALVTALLSGWLGRVRRQGRAVVVSIVLWGVAIVGFGLSRVLWLGVVLLAVAGAADMVSAVFRTAILQVSTPDEMRGRLSGVFFVVVAGGPRLGDLEAGAVAALTSPAFSVVSGGVACVVGVLALAAAVPRFLRYDARHPSA